MVSSIKNKITEMLAASPEEIKALLPQFIEKIELDGNIANIKYAVSDEQNVACYWRPQGDSNPRSPP